MKQEPHIKVDAVMTDTVHTIDSMATVRKTMAKMAKHQISSLLVERREASDEYGVITVADIAREVVAKNLSFDRVQVYEVMSKPVMSIDPGMDLRYAIRLLVQFELRRALVIGDDRQIIGMVTLRDMVLRYAEQHEAGAGS
jgi:signal-transduction protein with cAMP-binding, CBS, and nucleotidyltransferase domain